MNATLDRKAVFIAEAQARGVRNIALETGIECSPLVLAFPEACPICNALVLTLVLPQRVCFDCWPDAFDSN
jgi:hypothetical protein